MIKAVFFDLDETLVNAIAAHIKAQRKAFTHFGYDYDEIDKRTQHHDFMGKRIIDILETQRDAMDISEQELPLSKLASKRQEFFLDLVKEEAKLLSGALEALKLAKEKGKIVAIVSSGTKKYIHMVVDIFEFQPYVDFIISGEDVTKGKPFPDCYLKAYNHLPKEKHIQKEECLVVEDAPNGVKAAVAAGLPVCFVPLFPPKEKVTVAYQLKSLKEFSTILE